MWTKIWNVYISNHAEPFDPANEELTTKHLVGFLYTVNKNGRLRGFGKHVLPESFLTSVLGYIKSHLVFTYHTFRFTEFMKTTILRWLKQMVRDGKLIRGVRRPRQFVTFLTLKKIMVKWFQAAFSRDCANFDTILAKALPISFMCAVDSRIGDIMAIDRLHVEKGSFMKLEDIQISIDGSELDVTKVKAIATLKYEKGEKGDRTLPWEDPKLPLFAAIHKQHYVRVSIEDAGVTSQVRDTFSRMGDIAGITPQLIIHDIRRGGAKDLSEGTMRGLGQNKIETTKRHTGHEDADDKDMDTTED
ncbi:hypothetical protein LTR84_008564 [Exophiala bonariae]|uniref:Uncharacterized protein n=1 Tax=Exophiala bonariae TaxID=1690606 RepID=A0AAV9MZU6_9EURO|nr:hypothetical protein LTR84_008564 [Exophiala bonariae]